jgi:hypothetical protein
MKGRAVNDSAPSALTVFRTQLPYVDRRSLSEAWFSALHLAGDGPPAGGRSASAAALGTLPSAAAAEHAGPAPAPYRAQGESAAASAASRRYAAALRPGIPDADGAAGARVRAESAPTPVAGRVRRYVERSTSLTLGVEGSRVQLLLRREGPVLHVVALCRADVADAVRLALARASGQLRVAGDSLRASVRVRP